MFLVGKKLVTIYNELVCIKRKIKSRKSDAYKFSVAHRPLWVEGGGGSGGYAGFDPLEVSESLAGGWHTSSFPEGGGANGIAQVTSTKIPDIFYARACGAR